MAKNNVYRPGLSEILWEGYDNKGQACGAGVYIVRMNAREKGERKTVKFDMRLTRIR
jgi:hypothetical protein